MIGKYKVKKMFNNRYHKMGSENSEIRIREITETDYQNGFIECLSVLTETGDISYEDFKERYNLIKSKGDYTILVAVYKNRIVGAGTLFIEYKFIHKLALKGHIEDIVVSKDFQKHGIGKRIVSALVDISMKKGCYKTALCSKEETVPFYKKCGFEEKERELVIYHNK